jgi:hypothetical protein
MTLLCCVQHHNSNRLIQNLNNKWHKNREMNHIHIIAKNIWKEDWNKTK